MQCLITSAGKQKLVINSFTFFLTVFLQFSVTAQLPYRVEYYYSDKDTGFVTQSPVLETSFTSQDAASVYLGKLHALLMSKGFVTSSIDSLAYNKQYAFVSLYLGKKYRFSRIATDSVDKNAIESTGWLKKQKGSAGFIDVNELKSRLLQYYERNGYPFASIRLDNISIEGDNISAAVHADKGPLYHIDSIRNYGRVRIRKYFLEKYLSINKGSLYNSQRLENISRKLRELPYLQEERPWDITMLGTGATINLYLMPKRSSQINFLVGLLPGNNTDRKITFTGDINLNLKNALGSGEGILLNWQQLQPKSPRLNIGYQQPYIFKSLFGIDFNFDLLKRDSSYLQINGQFGLQYVLSANQSGKIFIQNYRSYLLPGAFDTNIIRHTKVLPQDIDLNSLSLGVDYEFYNTDYRLNPRKGNELRIILSAGLKKISMNNDIVTLKDPADPGFNFRSLYDSIKTRSYQLRSTLLLAHFFPVGKKTVLKAALQAGFVSSQQLFRNELFQLGGYKLLRGFNEQSVFSDKYVVATAEYRILTDVNSYFFLFSDLGLSHTNYQQINFSNNFISGGIGINLETKFGLLNFSYAVGKRNDVKFDLRQSSKIHFGYINYF